MRDRSHFAEEAKVVDFERERDHRKWRVDSEQILAAHAEMTAAASPEDAAVALFRLARKHRDLRIGQPAAVVDINSFEANYFCGIPRDEAKRIIRAAMYRGHTAECDA
jgi:hypothetical protein